MPVFAFDDDWVQITADDYINDEDAFGAPITDKALITLSDGQTVYLGIFGPDTFEEYPDEYDYDVDDEDE